MSEHRYTLAQTAVSGLFAGVMGLVFAILLTDPSLLLKRIPRLLVLALPPFLFTLFANTFQMASMPFLPVSSKFFRFTMWWSSWVCGVVWWLLQRNLEEPFGHCNVTMSGDVLPPGESAFVVANHVSMTDFFLINAIAIRKRMLPNVKYILKDSLKWLPAFGWGMYMCGHVFIKRNWTTDSEKILAAFGRIRDLDIPLWLISYVEGTRKTVEKHRASNQFARERGLKELNNLLLPRTTGFVSTVKAMRNSQMTAVYDFTFAYQKTTSKGVRFGEAPSLLRIHLAPIDDEYQIHIHVKRYPMDSLPQDDAGLQKWLYDRWVEKDKLMGHLKDQWTEDLPDMLSEPWDKVFDLEPWQRPQADKSEKPTDKKSD